MKKLAFVVACLAITSSFAKQEPLGAGAAAPNYTFKNAKDGKFMSLHSFKGKYKAIVLDFFASWCGPCQRLIPDVIEMHKNYKRKGVLVIGVDVWDKWADMQKNIKSAKIPYLVLNDPKAQGGVTSLYKVQGIPVLFIIDGKTMTIKGSFSGAPTTAGEMSQRKSQVMAALNGLGVR